jgi:hypothetical protein
MDRYLLLDRWGTHVRTFKESEKAYDQDGYTSENLARLILDYSRFTRFRQWTLYTQQRGKEFEGLLTRVEREGYSVESAKRFLDDEPLWAVTLELAAQ